MAKLEHIEAETVYTMDELARIGPQFGQQPTKTNHEQTLEDIIQSLNDQSDNVRLSVFRQLGTGKEAMSLIGSWPVDQFATTEEMLLWLRDNYGGGSYRAQVRVKGVLRANKLLHVEEAITSKRDGIDHGKMDSGLISSFMSSQERLMERLLAAKPSTTDNESAFLEKMLMYKQLFSSPVQTAVSGGIGQLRELIEVGQSLGLSFGGVGTEKEEGFSEMLKSSLPLLTAAISASANSPKPQHQPQQRSNPVNMQEANFRMGINILLGAAKKRADPSVYARMIDDQYGEQALQVAASPDSLARMASYVPDVGNYSEWFNDLSEHVKAINGLPSKFSAEYADDNEEGVDDGVFTDGNTGGEGGN